MKFEIGQEVYFINVVDSNRFDYFSGTIEDIRIVRDEKNLSNVIKYNVHYDKYGFPTNYLVKEEKLFGSYNEMAEVALKEQRKIILNLLADNTKEFEKIGVNINSL